MKLKTNRVCRTAIMISMDRRIKERSIFIKISLLVKYGFRKSQVLTALKMICLYLEAIQKRRESWQDLRARQNLIALSVEIVLPSEKKAKDLTKPKIFLSRIFKMR